MIFPAGGGPAVGGRDVAFFRISVVPHKFLAQGSAFGMLMSIGFQLDRTNFGPGIGVWDVDFYGISVVPHKFMPRGRRLGYGFL